MIISLIAAVGKNREIGKENTLIWKIPPDLKTFQRNYDESSHFNGKKNI